MTQTVSASPGCRRCSPDLTELFVCRAPRDDDGDPGLPLSPPLCRIKPSIATLYAMQCRHCLPDSATLFPNIRDGLLDEAITLGRMVFSAHFVRCDRRWHLRQLAPRAIFAIGAGIFEGFRHGSAMAVSGSQERNSAGDHDLSRMAPPSRMMRAQRSRIALNMSTMAAPILRNVCRPWRTILPAV